MPRRKRQRNRLQPKPSLEQLESRAIKVWPAAASHDSLWILHAQGSIFIYNWGDANVSRHEAVRRLSQLPTPEPS